MNSSIVERGWEKRRAWTTQRQRILVVDDEVLVRQILSETLADAGYETAEAGDEDRAIDMLAGSVVFDLLLTDISMLGPTDGNALDLRAKRLCPGIPVIYLSDRLTNGVGDPDAFMRKPFGLDWPGRDRCRFGGWRQPCEGLR